MGLSQEDRDFLQETFSGTLDDEAVILLRSTGTATVLGEVQTSWATATSFTCNIQPIEAFRKIQEGMMLGPQGLDLISTHRLFVPLGERVFEGDRIEQTSGSAREYFNIRNVREYTGSHIEVDAIRVRP